MRYYLQCPSSRGMRRAAPAGPEEDRVRAGLRSRAPATWGRCGDVLPGERGDPGPERRVPRAGLGVEPRWRDHAMRTPRREGEQRDRAVGTGGQDTGVAFGPL